MTPEVGVEVRRPKGPSPAAGQLVSSPTTIRSGKKEARPDEVSLRSYREMWLPRRWLSRARRRVPRWFEGGNPMSEDIELVAKQVEKQKAKLSEQSTLLQMTEKRASTAEKDRQRVAREAERLRKRAKDANQEARRLSREAERAQLRFEASEAAVDQADDEVKQLTKKVEKRQQKLTTAEATYAAAQAEAHGSADAAVGSRFTPGSRNSRGTRTGTSTAGTSTPRKSRSTRKATATPAKRTTRVTKKTT